MEERNSNRNRGCRIWGYPIHPMFVPCKAE
jgi:hypothetical protein